MRVLIGLEESATIREEFEKLGHDVWSCDLQPTRKPGKHFQTDIRNVLALDFVWDLMIAHPPCTDTAVAGAPSFAAKRADGRQQAAIDFFMWLWNVPVAKVKRMCLEHPVSVISTVFRKPDQIIQPYFFGDADSKKTCLWLKNLPLLTWDDSTKVEPEYLIYKSQKTKSGISKYPKNWKLPPGENRRRERSKTYQGIARAMAQQWGQSLESAIAVDTFPPPARSVAVSK